MKNRDEYEPYDLDALEHVPSKVPLRISKTQHEALSCNSQTVMLTGNRGGGKTFCMIMDYLLRVNIGLDKFYEGKILRPNYRQLDGLKKETMMAIEDVFGHFYDPKNKIKLPYARFLKGERRFIFPNGESLVLDYVDSAEDANKFKGSQLMFIGYDELTNFSDKAVFRDMNTLLRFPKKKIINHIRTEYGDFLPVNKSVEGFIKGRLLDGRIFCATNPGGVGHHWVREEFKLNTYGRVSEEINNTSVFLLQLEENDSMDKNYIDTLKEGLTEEDDKYKINVLGMWDINVDAYFVNAFSDNNILDIKRLIGKFEWNIAYDHGHNDPYAIGIYATAKNNDCYALLKEDVREDWIDTESESVESTNIYELKKGDSIRMWEGIGKQGHRLNAEDIAKVIHKGIWQMRDYTNGEMVEISTYVADTNVFVNTGVKSSAGDEFRKAGIDFIGASKSGTNNRVHSANNLRNALRNGHNHSKNGLCLYMNKETTRYSCEFLPKFISNPKKIEESGLIDIREESFDHFLDEMRYFISFAGGAEAFFVPYI